MNLLKTSITIIAIIGSLLSAKAQQAKQPLTITNLKVYEKDNKQIIEWTADSTGTGNYWEVQSSTDNQTFTTIALVLGDDPTKPGTYKLVNGAKTVKTAKKYYRVCYVYGDGTAQTSKIIEPAK